MKLFKLNEILAEKGINFNRIYLDTGIKYVAVKKICDNVGNVSVDTLLRLAEYLDIKLVDLFVDNQSFSQEKFFKMGYEQALQDLKENLKKM